MLTFPACSNIISLLASREQIKDIFNVIPDFLTGLNTDEIDKRKDGSQ